MLIGCALVALVWYAFSPTLSNEFTNWDDHANFVDNEAFWGLGWSQVRWAWTTVHMGSYQPLGWIAYSTEFVFFGLDPRGYHAVSVLLYAAFIAALYALTLAVLRRWRHPDPPEPALDLWAGAVVALYAVHPLRVEVVACASAQSYLSAALFFVLATLAYVRACDARPRPRTTWIVISLVSFLAAVLCKAPVATLPALLVALERVPAAKTRRRGGLDRTGRTPGLARQSAVRSHWRGVPDRRLFRQGHDVHRRPERSSFVADPRRCRVLFAMVLRRRDFSVPTDLALFYVIPHPVSWRQPAFLLALGLTAVSGSALFFARRRFATLVPFVAASVAILLPMSGLVSISTQLVSDRHAFFATIPWIFPVTAVLGSFVRRGWRMTVAVLVTISAVVILTIQTRSLAQTWQTSETLWTRALASPSNRSLMAYNNLAAVYQDRGENRSSHRALSDRTRVGARPDRREWTRPGALESCRLVGEPGTAVRSRGGVRGGPEVIPWVDHGPLQDWSNLRQAGPVRRGRESLPSRAGAQPEARGRAKQSRGARETLTQP